MNAICLYILCGNLYRAIVNQGRLEENTGPVEESQAQFTGGVEGSEKHRLKKIKNHRIIE